MLDWRPDLDPTTSGNLTYVNNMMPTERGYKGWHYPTAQTSHQLTLQANESPISCLYATRWLSVPGGICIAGTNKDLYVYDYTNGFIKVSKAGGYALTGATYQYGEDATSSFDMCSFGDVLIATHKSIVAQYRSSLDLTIGTLFANLGTTVAAPQASVCAVSSNFVFLGDINSTCGTTTSVAGTRDMVCWSKIGDHQNWDVDPAVTQGSYAVFNDTPGPITALAALADGIVVFKAQATYLGRYVGAGPNSPIWDFVRISDRIGCIGHRSVTNIGGQLVFVGAEDIYIYDGASLPKPITRGIWQTEIQGKTNVGGIRPMWIGHDQYNGCVIFTRSDSTGFWLLWSYRHNRWSALNVYGEGALTGVNGAGSDPICFAKSNTNDFRKITSTTFSGTVSSDHTDVYTMFATNVENSGGFPSKCQVFNRFNTNTAWSALCYLGSSAFGHDDHVTKISRVIPKWGSAPTTATLRQDTKANLGVSWTESGTEVSMNSRYRFDLQALGGTAANWHRFMLKLATHAGAEVIELRPEVESTAVTPMGRK